MELHGEIAAVVLPCQKAQQCPLVGGDLAFRKCLALHGLFHHDGGVARAVAEADEAVVGDAAAHLTEEVEGLGERGAEAVPIGDFAVASGKLLHGGRPCTLVDVQKAVGAEGGQRAEGHFLIRLQLQVPLQAVGGVIGGAEDLHVGLVEQGHGIKALATEHGGGFVPNLTSRGGGERDGDAEIALQLQMCPVVHGAADEAGQHRGELLKLLVLGSVARHIVLGHTADAHDAPLIVIGLQPQLGQVLVAAALVDLTGVEVVMVVHDGTVRRVVVVEGTGGGGMQEKITIHKCSH